MIEPSARSPSRQSLALEFHDLLSGEIRYCLSYTARELTLLPAELVPLVVTVRVRPSAETTIRPVKVILRPFLAVNANVWLFIFRYERVSEVGSPVTG